MFVDASAMCAILLSEPECDLLASKLAGAALRVTSAIAIFETIGALMRERELAPSQARAIVARFLSAADIESISIGDAERDAALDAMDQFGEGRHPARLNMGDCFAYGCARSRDMALLFKSDDFSRTDIVAA